MTRARIPLIEKKQDLAHEQREVWDQIAESRGHVAGPFAALLQSPEIARRVAHLGAYVRFESALGPVQRELAILATARALDCRYEWAAHVPLARRAGVRPEAVAAIGARRAPAGLTADEAAVVTYVTELLRTHRVADGTFAAARERLDGDRALVELTATAGYYALIACTLNAFAVEPEPGADLLPD